LLTTCLCLPTVLWKAQKSEVCRTIAQTENLESGDIKQLMVRRCLRHIYGWRTDPISMTTDRASEVLIWVFTCDSPYLNLLKKIDVPTSIHQRSGQLSLKWRWSSGHIYISSGLWMRCIHIILYYKFFKKCSLSLFEDCSDE
jgi:hypothetical protein